MMRAERASWLQGSGSTLGDHRVIGYARDLQLVRAVGGFAADALTRGGGAVLIADPGLLAAVEEWVRLQAVRLDDAIAAGRYRVLEAPMLLRRLTRDPDPVPTFEGLLQGALRAVPAVEPLHVFGDLAAMLWDSGQVTTALGVEAVGGRVAAQPGVSVLCSYRAAALAAPRAQAVHRCHTTVIAPPTCPPVEPVRGERKAEAKIFPPTLAACRAARRFVGSALAEEPADLVDRVTLVCSELVANAVRHASSPFTVQISASPGAVRLAVSDEGTFDGSTAPFPVGRSRGLGIVSAFSRAWDVQPLATGKVVWAEVPCAER